MSKRFFSVPEFAEETNTSEKFVWKKIYAREIETVKFGRLRRISREALDQFIANSTIPARPAVQ